MKATRAAARQAAAAEDMQQQIAALDAKLDQVLAMLAPRAVEPEEKPADPAPAAKGKK